MKAKQSYCAPEEDLGEDVENDEASERVKPISQDTAMTVSTRRYYEVKKGSYLSYFELRKGKGAGREESENSEKGQSLGY